MNFGLGVLVYGSGKQKVQFQYKADVAHSAAGLKSGGKKTVARSTRRKNNDAEEGAVKTMLVFFFYCFYPLIYSMCTVSSAQV